MMETLSIVVPCLNEQEAIPLFYSAVLKETAGMDVAFEFWFVDDGSTDGTLDALKRLREQGWGHVALVPAALEAQIASIECLP